MDQSDSPSQEENPLQLGRLESLVLRFGVVGEMMVHFASGRNWWLTPLVLLLGLLGLALVFLQSIEYVAPFVYLAI